MKLIIRNAWICPYQNGTIQPFFGSLTIENGKIVAFQKNDFNQFTLQTQAPHSGDSGTAIIDAQGKVVTVPLINFHDHFYSRLAKGLPIAGPMDNFVNILKTLWWKLDRLLDTEMVKACARVGAMDSIKQGVTYIFDHHASPEATPGSLPAIAEVLREFNLRGTVCFETSDRNGEVLRNQALQENLNFLSHYSDNHIKGMIGLHAPFTLHDETLRQAADIQQKTGAGIHIHVAEDAYDVQDSLENYGFPPVERLRQFGLLSPNSILVHGVHLTEKDYSVLRQSGAALAYNPDSNLNNAVGIPSYRHVPDSIPVLVGTDGMHANIARSHKQLFLLYRHQGNSFDEAFNWFVKIYRDEQTFVRQYFPDFPALQVGDRADLVIWDYVPPTPFHSDNFWGHYIYGILESPAHTVIQEGRILLQSGKLLVEYYPNVLESIREQGYRLYQKFATTE